MKKNIILMYHSISNGGGGEVGSELYSVSVEKFKEQMKYIADIDGTRSPEKKPIITFDDGLVDNYDNAFPILKSYGHTAYFFVLAPRIGTEGYLDWEQLKKMRKNGMIIGSHGMTHRILVDLINTELDYEIIESKKILEDNMGEQIEYFSIPRGFYNRRVIAKARIAGYKTVFTSNLNDYDGFKYGRIAVKENWNINYFTKIIKKGPSVQEKAKESLKNTAKKFLGSGAYDKLRTKILSH
jgi:peptidoglycan/xylan/chitin deacetylase (PgdA/CDA1 family)